MLVLMEKEVVGYEEKRMGDGEGSKGMVEGEGEDVREVEEIMDVEVGGKDREKGNGVVEVDSTKREAVGST